MTQPLHCAPRWANIGKNPHLRYKSLLRPVEGLLEAEFEALYHGERVNMIKSEFESLDLNCHFGPFG